MHATISHWRFRPESATTKQFDEFMSEAARRVVPILRNLGMLDVFIIRTSPDTIKFINIYETREDADLAQESVWRAHGFFLGRHLELIDRSGGETVDLLAYTSDLPGQV